MEGLLRGIRDGIRNIGSWIKTNIFDPFINGFKAAFGIASPSTVMAEQGDFIVQGLLQGIKDAWNNVVSFFSEALSGITSAITQAWNTIKTTTSTVWKGVKATLSTAWNSIKSTASTTWTNLKTIVSNGWSNVKSNTTSTWNSIKSSLSSTWNSIKSTASTAFSDIKNTIQNKGWSGVGSSIVSGIKSGISNGWSALTNWISQKAQSLLSAAKRALGIHSPSRAFRDEVGLNIGLGIGEGLEDSEASVLKSVTGVADAIADEMNAGDYKLTDIVPVTEINGAITNFTDKITDGFTTMLDRLQAIAESVTFTAPVVTNGVVPYRVAHAVGTGSTANIGDAIEASNAEMSTALIQTITNTAAAIVNAIQEYSGATVNLDANSLTERVITEINRKTRMNGKSPLLI